MRSLPHPSGALRMSHRQETFHLHHDKHRSPSPLQIRVRANVSQEVASGAEHLCVLSQKCSGPSTELTGALLSGHLPYRVTTRQPHKFWGRAPQTPAWGPGSSQTRSSHFSESLAQGHTSDKPPHLGLCGTPSLAIAKGTWSAHLTKSSQSTSFPNTETWDKEDSYF